MSRFLILFIVIIFIVACQLVPSPIPPISTPTRTMQTTPSVTPSLPPTSTSTPRPTDTPTPTATPRPTSTFTPTPKPKLSDLTMKELIHPQITDYFSPPVDVTDELPPMDAMVERYAYRLKGKPGLGSVTVILLRFEDSEQSADNVRAMYDAFLKQGGFTAVPLPRDAFREPAWMAIIKGQYVILDFNQAEVQVQVLVEITNAVKAELAISVANIVGSWQRGRLEQAGYR